MCHYEKNLVNLDEHIELPAKLLDYFLRSNKSNINQCQEPQLIFLAFLPTLQTEYLVNWGPFALPATWEPHLFTDLIKLKYWRVVGLKFCSHGWRQRVTHRAGVAAAKHTLLLAFLRRCWSQTARHTVSTTQRLMLACTTTPLLLSTPPSRCVRAYIPAPSSPPSPPILLNMLLLTFLHHCWRQAARPTASQWHNACV